MGREDKRFELMDSKQILPIHYSALALTHSGRLTDDQVIVGTKNQEVTVYIAGHACLVRRLRTRLGRERAKTCEDHKALTEAYRLQKSCANTMQPIRRGLTKGFEIEGSLRGQSESPYSFRLFYPKILNPNRRFGQFPCLIIPRTGYTNIARPDTLF
jgi:hypothetical protein